MGGDLNSRIGEIEGYMKNIDNKVDGNDREWLAMARATGITTLTCLKETAQYTYFHSQGNSVVDHICIDDEHVEVIRKLENRKEVIGRIDTDHSTVVAKMKIRNSEERKTGQQRNEGTNKSERRRKVSRIKKKKYGNSIKERCNKSMELARVIDG